MKTALQIVQDIQTASDNNQLMKLITIHDELLTTDIGIVEKSIKILKKDTITYDVFVSAGKMSKVDSNGVFKNIIKQQLKREQVFA